MTIAELVIIFFVITFTNNARDVLLTLIVMTAIVHPLYMAFVLFLLRKNAGLLIASAFLLIPIWLVWIVIMM